MGPHCDTQLAQPMVAVMLQAKSFAISDMTLDRRNSKQQKSSVITILWYQHVNLEIPWMTEVLVTLLASLRLLSNVYQHIIPETPWITEVFVTLLASIRLLCLSIVTLQTSWLTGGFVTLLASIWLLSTVYQHVIIQGSKLSEWSRTLLVSMKVLSSVYQHVVLKIPLVTSMQYVSVCDFWGACMLSMCVFIFVIWLDHNRHSVQFS